MMNFMPINLEFNCRDVMTIEIVSLSLGLAEDKQRENLARIFRNALTAHKIMKQKTWSRILLKFLLIRRAFKRL